jgi:sarcosine oxidase
MGSAAAYHLARRGRRVLGLDAFAPGHARGSSHGRSRILRTAYPTPQYVPLVRRATVLWRELEAESGTTLLTMTGMLLVGSPGTPMIDGPLSSARQHDLPYELLGPAEVTARFPGFRLTGDLAAVYEPLAGFLRPESCVAAHLDLAARHGATLRHAEPVSGWAVDGDGVSVTTSAGRYTADRLVLTPGPWAGELLADLGLPLTVQRVVNVHFEPTEPARFAPERCPVFGWEVPEGHYYGSPALPGEGLKIGKNVTGHACTPATVQRTVEAAEIDDFRRMLDRYMPGAAGAVKWPLTCLYTNTPDGHFVIDQHPRHRQVVIAGGCSGHAFKYTSVIGEILADLVVDGATRHPIGFLSAARFSPAASPP